MGHLKSYCYRYFFSLCFIFLCPAFAWCQYNFAFDQSVNVMENENPLRLPWAGGLNSGQYQSMDIDLDGTEDLVIFDRTSNKVSCFLRQGEQYVYSPAYEYLFPKDLNNWLVLADFNCDGQKDIFTSSVFGMKAYQGVVVNGALTWKVAADPVNTLGFSNLVNLQVNSADIPAIVDVDTDGDLDILVFNFTGSGTIEFHKNFSLEEDGQCGLNFKRVNNKWGDFEECTCGTYAIGTSCAAINGKAGLNPQRILHAGGKALLLLDYDGDGDKEMIFGDEGCDNLAFFENIGNSTNAAFQSFEENFPPGASPDFSFPSGYYLDIDRDGLKDLMVAPNLAESRLNLVNFTHSSWFYKNIGSAENPEFNLVQKDFLQEEMIDRGENAAPAFADIDQDGKVDMLVGNKGILYGDQFYATLAFYRNVGTASAPAFSLIDEDYLGLSQLNLQQLYPSFADLNGDGHQDLYFIGTSADGQETAMYYIFAENGEIKANAPLKTLSVEVARDDRPFFADLNHDGFADLLILRSSGRLEYHEFSSNPEAPIYVLANDALSGFTDKFENRNLIPAVNDLDADGLLELIISDAAGKLYVSKEIFSNTEGLQNMDTLTVANESLDFNHATRFGRQTRVAFAPLFEGELPVMVVGSRQGGLFFLRNEQTTPGPGNEDKVSLTVFPNPAEGFFKLHSSAELTVALYDLLGKKLGAAFSVPAGVTYTYSTTDLSAGIYLIKATDRKGRSITRKILIL